MFSLLQNLERLDLTDNFIGSTLPSELGTLGNLQRLELHNNLLEGALPTDYGRLESLEIIHLQYNLLDGHLPSEIGLLSNLRVFNIKENVRPCRSYHRWNIDSILTHVSFYTSFYDFSNSISDVLG